MGHRTGDSGPMLRLSLIGGFDACAASGTVLNFHAQKTQALVTYLALETNTRHFRTKLAALLWGEVNDHQARDSLRHALHEIRRVFDAAAPGVLLLSEDKVALDPSEIYVDVTEFERLIADGSYDALSAAAEMYKGDLLDGLAVEEEPFEQWLSERRARLRDRTVGALQALLHYHSRSKRYPAAIDTARRLLSFDVLQEPVHRTLMQLYDSQGRRATALRQYEVCVDVLQRDLAAEPAEETKALYQAILRRDTSRASRLEVRDEPTGTLRDSAREVPRRDMLQASTPLIGRDSEMARLQSLLRDVWNGKGACVFVVGEAGIGKSRLVLEISMAAARQNARVLTGRCYETEQILSFGPWLSALRSGDLSRADVAPRLDPAWADELAWLIPELAPQDAKSTHHTDYRRMFEAVLHLIVQVAGIDPVLFVLEDLQWADDISVRLLAFLGRRLATSRVLFIATVRKEEVEQCAPLQQTLDELTNTTATRTMELGALCQADALALVQSLTVADGSGAVTASLAAKICDTSQGNPFLVVETLRSLREGTTFPPAELPLSKRVEHLVHSRIKGLSDNSRSLVRVAAAIGHACHFAVMARAAQLPEARVADAVEEMVRRRILHAIGDRIEFTHDWLREVVYAALLPGQRRLLHEQVAAAWEATWSGDGGSVLSTLTFHYRLAEVWDKAAFYARKAAEQAFAKCSYSEASALLEQARTALDQLPRTPQVLLETIDVRLALHRSLVPAGVVARTMENLREIEQLIATIDDDRRSAQLSLHLSLYFRTTGDHRRAIDHAQSAVAAARKSGCAALLNEAHFHLGHTRYSRGEFRSAIALLDQSVHDLQQRPPTPRYTVLSSVDVVSRSYMAWALAFVGDFVLATKVAKEAINAAEATAEPVCRVEANRALGFVLVEKGDFTNAIPLLEEALRLCLERHLDLLHSLVASTLGYAYAITGSLDNGISLMERAVEQRASLRGEYPGSLGTYLLSRLADGYLCAGRTIDAASVAAQTARLAERYDNRVDQARSLRLWGDIAARQDRPDIRTAEARYAQSRAIAVELEMRPFVAHCDLRLGSLLECNGHATKGRAALNDALGAFTGLDMPFWATCTRDMLSKPAIAGSLKGPRGARTSRVARR